MFIFRAMTMVYEKVLKDTIVRIEAILQCKITLTKTSLGYKIDVSAENYKYLQSPTAQDSDSLYMFLYGLICGLQLEKPINNSQLNSK